MHISHSRFKNIKVENQYPEARFFFFIKCLNSEYPGAQPPIFSMKIKFKSTQMLAKTQKATIIKEPRNPKEKMGNFEPICRNQE